MKPALLLLAGSALLAGCQPQDALTVQGGDPITYTCDQQAKVTVRYFSLSDDSLHFVKLTLPDGTPYTLPQVVSASGARFSDLQQLVWWNKGDGGFVEQLDDDGEWQILLDNCREK